MSNQSKKMNCRFDLLDEDFMVCCSGGVDSVAVSHFLHKRSKGKMRALFHFNHGFRRQNDLMQQKVIALSYLLNLPLYIQSTGRFPIKKRGSVEANARESRINAMDFVAQQTGIRNFVMCHHLDDAVEGYLMECFKGTEIRDERDFLPSETQFLCFNIVRPFLKTPKEVLINYVNKHELCNFVEEDETNTDTRLRRNFIRHDVIPLLMENYPGLHKVVGKFIM